MEITHEDLFDNYVEELSAAKVEIMEWWNGLYQDLPEGLDEDEKEKQIRLRWPAGPASHPRIIAIFRKYYFEVERLNEHFMGQEPEESAEGGWGVETEEKVSKKMSILPQSLLLDQLETDAPELLEMMEYFVYMPIGIDPDGTKC